MLAGAGLAAGGVLATIGAVFSTKEGKMLKLINLGKYDDAITLCNEIISKNPHNAIAYNNLGVAYERKGNFIEAIKAYQRTTEINPQFQLALNNLNTLNAKISKEEVPGISKKCLQCAEIIKAEAKICRFCGYKFEQAPCRSEDVKPPCEVSLKGIEQGGEETSKEKLSEEEEPPKTEHFEGTITCSRCGTKNKWEDLTEGKYCSGCGKDIEEEVKRGPVSTEETHRDKVPEGFMKKIAWTILSCVGATIVLILISNYHPVKVKSGEKVTCCDCAGIIKIRLKKLRCQRKMRKNTKLLKVLDYVKRVVTEL